MECSALPMALRRIRIRSWKDVVALAVGMAVYLGIIKLLERFAPLMTENTRQIISGIVTVIVTVALLFALDA